MGGSARRRLRHELRASGLESPEDQDVTSLPQRGGRGRPWFAGARKGPKNPVRAIKDPCSFVSLNRCAIRFLSGHRS